MNYKFCSTISVLLFFFLFLFSLNNLQAQDTSETKPRIGTTQKLGDVILFALPTATMGTSLLMKDYKGSWQFAKGFLLTQAITYGLKTGINKQRPDMSNDNSFPSGHTSTVFHSAGYIHGRYGFKYSIPSYVLAGFTAASRIDSKKHDILDVFAGAAIGLGSNLLFTTREDPTAIQLTYVYSEESHILGFIYKF